MHLAPLHPANEDRCAALINRKWLFRPNREVAFFAGLLTGLALNSNFLAFTSLLGLTDLISRSTGPSLGNSGSTGMLLLVVALMGFAFLLMFLGQMVICSAFAVIPLAGTLGVQVQKAAIADRIEPAGAVRLLSPAQIAGLACVAGGGILLGFWCPPWKTSCPSPEAPFGWLRSTLLGGASSWRSGWRFSGACRAGSLAVTRDPTFPGGNAACCPSSQPAPL